jgi:hypothetical protein
MVPGDTVTAGDDEGVFMVSELPSEDSGAPPNDSSGLVSSLVSANDCGADDGVGGGDGKSTMVPGEGITAGDEEGVFMVSELTALSVLGCSSDGKAPSSLALVVLISEAEGSCGVP